MSDFIYYVTPVIAAGISVILIVLILRRGPRNLASTVFSLILVSLALWSTLILLLRTSDSTDTALFWSRLLLPPGYALFIFYYHFTCLYTNRTNKTLVLLAYISLIAVTLFAPTGKFISHVTLESYGYASHNVLEAPFYMISVAGFVFIVLGLVNLVRTYRNLTSPTERKSLLLMIIAILTLIVLSPLDLMPKLPPIGIYGNILFCVLTTVALLRFHLFDINVAVRKITAYLVLAAGIAVPYIGMILLFSHRLEGAAYIGVSVLVFLVFVITLQPFWRKVQAIVDRLFYRERYRFLEELEQFSQEYHDISDLKGLSSSLGNILGRALQTTNVYILTVTDSGSYETIYATDENSEPITLGRNHPVVGWAKENEGIVSLRDFDVIPRLELISSRERVKLSELKAELFVPLKTKKNELVGLFILCEKTSNQPFSGEDVRLIMTVADRISVELENARLYSNEIEVRKQLEAQNEEKIEFLHQVAHEMKTPLTSLIASSDLLIENLSSGDDINRRLVVNIQRSSESMDRRVTELLFSAGLESPDIEIKVKPVDLTEVIEVVTGQSGFLFTEKEQTLKVQVADNLPKVKADRGRLEQILTNILSNANKFSPSGSEINLRTYVDGNNVIIEVEDEAEKITSEDEERLFEPYFRSENIGKRSTYPGLGLGLAITKRLLEMQNGRIWINHNSKKGNIFAFSLPVAD